MTQPNNEQTRDVKALADDFLDRMCEISPLMASEEGFSEYDDRIGDLSPRKHERLARLARTTQQLIKSCELNNFHDHLCADVLNDYCTDLIDEYESGDWVRCINIMTNPLDTIHSTCYNVNESDEIEIEKREKKIAEIPEALKSYRATLRYGVDHDCLPRRTQLVQMAYNCSLFANDPLFVSTPARNAYLTFGAFLTDDIIPRSKENDAVGPEQYLRAAKRHLGKTINLEETYQWGWHEIHSIFDEIALVIQDLNPGKSYRETIEMLEHDETRTASSPSELQTFLQDLLDESVRELNGTHFDIDPRLITIEACLFDEAGSSAMYYSTPSEDFSRPGRTYYPINGKKSFPLWEEVTTCYHEGLPGHHLHIGTIKCLGDDFSRFQKTVAFNTGESEGWALYAERLMVELGYNNDPAYIFGMLNASLFRATRIVMDIGLHCEFTIPIDAPVIFPRGEKWTKETAVNVLQDVIGMSESYARDEVHRYLGWIGQAISYKIGEKTIHDLRERERKRLGSTFSLKEFHSRVLGYGHIGLGRLEALFE
ncbi:MAG TPA: DUF885 domain-containing protein [Acidimicrobiia bacterium]|nr:DUF885 domain-containing protein [Acidimicrobiia bacterium]